MEANLRQGESPVKNWIWILIIFLAVLAGPAGLFAQDAGEAPHDDSLIEEPLVGDAPAQEGDHGEQESGGIFSGSLAEAWWTIIWFVLLMAVLGKFAWKPILQGLQAREDHIARQVEEAEEIKKKAQDVLDQYRSKLSSADEEGQRLITSRMKQAEKEAHEAVEKTQKEIDQMRERAKAEIERSSQQAEVKLREQAGEMVMRLSEEILRRTITEQDNQRLIDEAIAKLSEDEHGGAGS